MNIRVILMAALLLPPQVSVSKIYSWVDEGGHQHFGDRVPEKYRNQSKTVEPDVHQPSADDVARTQRDAQAQREIAKRMEHSSSRPRTVEPRAPQRSLLAKPTGPGVSQQDYRNLSCKEKWKVYKQSDACYAGCATVSGGTYSVPGPFGPIVKSDRGRSVAGCEACGEYPEPPLCDR